MSAVEQIKSAVASIPTPCIMSQGGMETDDAHTLQTYNPHQPYLEIRDLVADFKQEIATIVIETRTLFQQTANLQMATSPKQTPVN